MRHTFPDIQQDPSSNSRDILAARWYAQQANRPMSRDYSTTHYQNAKAEAPRNLGAMFVENHLVMNRAMNGSRSMSPSAEEAIAALAAARNNIHTPSISSTQDMERAQMTMFDDENRIDDSLLPMWPPPEIDAFDDFQSFIPNLDEKREVSPPQTINNDYRGYDIIENDPVDRSFDNITPLRQAGRSGIIPTPALADIESMTSPRGEMTSPAQREILPRYDEFLLNNQESEQEHQQYESNVHDYWLEQNSQDPVMVYDSQRQYQYNGTMSEMASATTATRSTGPYSSIVENNSLIEPNQQITNSHSVGSGGIFDFLRNPCSGTLQSAWNSNTYQDEEKADTSRNERSKKSFWSYLDPNDDLVYYDDGESTSSAELLRQNKNSRSPKSSTKSSKSASRSRKTRSKSPENEKKIEKHSDLNSFRHAYEDLMFIGSGNQNVNPSTPGRQSPTNREQNHRKKTTDDVPLKFNRSVTLSESVISESASTDRSKSRSESPRRVVSRSKSPDRRVRPGERQEDRLRRKKIKSKSPDPRSRTRDNKKEQTKSSKRSEPRVRVTITSNVTPNSRQNSKTPKSTSVASTPVQQSRLREEKRKGVNEESADQMLTPRASNLDGFETTASFVPNSRQLNNTFDFSKIRSVSSPNKATRNSQNIEQARSPKSKSRGRSRPASSDKREERQKTAADDDGLKSGLFPFKPDFYMLQALGKEIVGGVPSVLPTREVEGTVDTQSKVESGVSNLSTDDSSGMSSETRRLKEKLNQVRNRSLKNMERLQELQMNSIRIPEQLPGSPHKGHNHQPWGSFEKHSETAIENANCFDPQDIAWCVIGGDAPNNKAKVQVKPPVHSGYTTVTSSTESHSTTSSFSTHTAPHIAFQKTEEPKMSEFEGHYMYVAYSRFGEDAKEVLQLCEHQNLPIPNHKNGEVLIKVMSSTISSTDTEIRRGEWADVRLSPYIIPGCTFVGKIDITEKKSAFSSFKPGDTVLSLVKSGSNARFMAVPRNQLVKVPPGIDADAAACLPEIYLTAFQVLHLNHRYGSVRYRNDSLKGQSILVMNGHSSLGRALIELSLAAGADFCYALVKPRQAEGVAKLGGVPLSKDPQDWLTLIGRQINLLVTVIDGFTTYADHLTKDHLKALNKDGEVVIVGQRGVDNSDNVVSNQPSRPASRLICKSNRIQDRTKSYNVFDSWESDKKQGKRDLEHLVKLLGDGRLKPDILERIPLSKIGKAHIIVETKRLSGYIICKPWLPQTYVPS